MAGGSWTPEANAKLLSRIIKRVKLGKADFEALAHEMGEGYTHRAIEGYVYRMQKKGEDGNTNGNGVASGTASPVGKSPKKPRAGKAPKNVGNGDVETPDASPRKRSAGSKMGALQGKRKNSDTRVDGDDGDDGEGVLNGMVKEEEKEEDIEDEKVQKKVKTED